MKEENEKINFSYSELKNDLNALIIEKSLVEENSCLKFKVNDFVKHDDIEVLCDKENCGMLDKIKFL